jgi:uncharacterized protein
MRTDIEFKTEDGLVLRGWHYRPTNGGGAWPTIVMAHGYSAVKEMYLDRFAEIFAATGLAAVVFDNRNFGASEGEPRQEINPWRQIEDYRDAISFAQTLPETDAARIGVWGSSYSGAHVIVLGAIDRRIKCVASQVPLSAATGCPSPDPGGSRSPRRSRVCGGPPQPVQGREAWNDPGRFAGPSRCRRAADTGFLAVVRRDREDKSASLAERSDLALRGDVPCLRAGSLHRVCQLTPLLIVVALGDHLTVADEALAAYERALHPKKLVTLTGGHFDAYVADFDKASAAARAWFTEHLSG